MASTMHRPGMSWATRVPAVIVMLMAVVLLGTTIVNDLFAVGPAFENLTDGFRPALTAQAIETAGDDAAALGTTGEEFQAFVGEQFPGVADGMAALPQVVPTFSGLIETLDAQRDLFASADAIPTSDLPATTILWALLIAGSCRSRSASSCGSCRAPAASSPSCSASCWWRCRSRSRCRPRPPTPTR